MDYSNAARDLAKVLLEKRIGLVYGGGRIGLMGILAKAVHEGGGDVIGVIPQNLTNKELEYTDLNDLRVVSSMHERKSLMAELSDGFIAMPGGLGTIEEFFEAVTWVQLSIHNKPCGLLNVNRFFDPLLRFIDHAVDEGFILQAHRSIIQHDDHAAGLLQKLEDYSPLPLDKAAWARSISK